MELATIMLMLAVGSFIFALLLVVLKFRNGNPQEVPYWIAAKLFQAAGSFMLYSSVGTFSALTVLGNIALLVGCAYEAWAVRILSGKTVWPWVSRLTIPVIAAVCLGIQRFAQPHGREIVFFVQSIFFFLPSAFLLYQDRDSVLEQILGWSYAVVGTVFLAASLDGGRVLLNVVPFASFFIFLTGGYIMLMLAKERSDLRATEMQASLERTKSQFQLIVETAIEGILAFDKDYVITFANEKIASFLGYTVDELVGRPFDQFVPEAHVELFNEQKSLRKSGQDSVYESCILGKGGVERWFLISAKAMLDESGNFKGSFAMLTDINDRKEMELALQAYNRQLIDLSNRDGLTGIANRRRFDEALEKEYARIRRSGSQLSVILLDIDHFKAYNDYYGHVTGDECLRKCGAMLEESVSRSVDLAARYGGEEFACLLPDTNLQGAVTVAERIQQRIADLKVEHKASPISQYVTASFGVITVRYSPEISTTDIIDMADKLLYKAKEAGRNRIEHAEWNGHQVNPS